MSEYKKLPADEFVIEEILYYGPSGEMSIEGFRDHYIEDPDLDMRPSEVTTHIKLLFESEFAKKEAAAKGFKLVRGNASYSPPGYGGVLEEEWVRVEKL